MNKERSADWVCTIQEFEKIQKDPDFQESIHTAMKQIGLDFL